MSIKACVACDQVNPEINAGCWKCGKNEFVPIDSPSRVAGRASRVSVYRSGTGLQIDSGSIVLTTGQQVPNHEIVEIIGLVFAAGNAAWTLEGTSNKSNTAMGKAASNLMSQARELGADAVVAIQMSMDGSGTSINRSQTVSLMGTAVVLRPVTE